MHAYRSGDRVLFRTTAGDLTATVCDVVADPGGRVVHVVEPEDGTPFPRLVLAGSDLPPAEDADEPHPATGG